MDSLHSLSASFYFSIPQSSIYVINEAKHQCKTAVAIRMAMNHACDICVVQ